MTKNELIDHIAKNADLSRAQAGKALSAALDGIKGALTDGDKVAIMGFGTFSVGERAGRQGVNPATKQPMEIQPYKVVRFKIGKSLKDAINS